MSVSMNMQSMLLRLMIGQWLGLAENRDYESTEELIRQMKAAIETLDTGGPEKRSEFVSHARDFIQLLREHIQKEDECLFRMADQAFSQQDQQQLKDSFDRVEHEDLGPGTHEKYLAIAGQLAKRFDVPCSASDAAVSACCHHGKS